VRSRGWVQLPAIEAAIPVHQLFSIFRLFLLLLFFVTFCIIFFFQRNMARRKTRGGPAEFDKKLEETTYLQARMDIPFSQVLLVSEVPPYPVEPFAFDSDLSPTSCSSLNGIM
jgi:quinol-cytochrome oxidoreductase complex cytochrome b subunit